MKIITIQNNNRQRQQQSKRNKATTTTTVCAELVEFCREVIFVVLEFQNELFVVVPLLALEGRVLPQFPFFRDQLLEKVSTGY